VTVKDAIFQASTPIRHAAELLAINKTAERKPEAFVIAFTDGGPDHNISFLNVMISWLAYFIKSGCDSLVVGRTAPTQSWTNPAERVMSILNLALSNCALAREAMDDEFEKNMKKCNSMTSVRKLADKDNAAMRVAEGDNPTAAVVAGASVTVDVALDVVESVVAVANSVDATSADTISHVTVANDVAAATFGIVAPGVTGAAWLIIILSLCVISMNEFLCLCFC
jgi:hypothetical protein